MTTNDQIVAEVAGMIFAVLAEFEAAQDAFDASTTRLDRLRAAVRIEELSICMDRIRPLALDAARLKEKR